jgi:putative transcriptional regulator
MGQRDIQRAKDVLARNIRVQRAIHDLSQSALADAAGTTQLTINRIEARKGNPTVATLAKIATALRIEVDALFAKVERGK